MSQYQPPPLPPMQPPRPPMQPPMHPYGGPPTPGKTSGMAIASLVLAILGFCTAGLAGLVAIVLGIVALLGINKSAGSVKGNGLAIAGIAVGAASLVFGCISLSLFLPAINQARLQARNVVQTQSLRDLAAATITYSAENQDRLPQAGDWLNALKTHITGRKNIDQLVVSPLAPEDNRALAMNINLDGKSMSRVSRPDKTVLFFECETGSPLAGGPELLPAKPRFRKGYAIVFVDAHADNIPPDQVNSLIWKP